MAASFFFYDLETSGFNPRRARIMQFAGQRTDADLNPVGEPVNILVRLSPDVLPDPDAVMITGITPQQTLSEGLTEAEFLKYFYEEVVRPDTIFLGYNSVRFDDEFMRYLHYRNFYDAYEWQWKDACSRWDLLDVVRMTRALRPEGVEWPVTDEGKPSNRLEFLTKANKLDHLKAHDALSDVHATISVARLIREKQPDLFKYLLSCRHKKVVKELVTKGEPFVYTTGRYKSEFLHTSAAVMLTPHEALDAALVYDLRVDPRPFLEMDVSQLAEVWKFTKDPEAPPRLPVKTLKYNRCPAVAPLGVMKDEVAQERIRLPLDVVSKHYAYLKPHRQVFAEKVKEAVRQLDVERAGLLPEMLDTVLPVDERLYDSFIDNSDKFIMAAVRAAVPDELSDYAAKFKDGRMKALLPLYKARNFPKSLNEEERAAWDAHCYNLLLNGGKQSALARYFSRLQELAAENPTGNTQYLLEELQLYGESLLPSGEADNMPAAESALLS